VEDHHQEPDRSEKSRPGLLHQVDRRRRRVRTAGRRPDLRAAGAVLRHRDRRLAQDQGRRLVRPQRRRLGAPVRWLLPAHHAGALRDLRPGRGGDSGAGSEWQGGRATHHRWQHHAPRPARRGDAAQSRTQPRGAVGRRPDFCPGRHFRAARLGHGDAQLDPARAGVPGSAKFLGAPAAGRADHRYRVRRGAGNRRQQTRQRGTGVLRLGQYPGLDQALRHHHAHRLHLVYRRGQCQRRRLRAHRRRGEPQYRVPWRALG